MIKVKNHKPLTGTFILFSVILFTFILAAGSAVYIFSMQQIIKTNKNNELTQILETEKIRLEAILKPEISIVLKLADSPVIKRHIINPDDPELERIAVEEIMSYRQAFSGFSIIFG